MNCRREVDQGVSERELELSSDVEPYGPKIETGFGEYQLRGLVN